MYYWMGAVMKLGIITYAYPHLKTEQIILNLLLRGGGKN